MNSQFISEICGDFIVNFCKISNTNRHLFHKQNMEEDLNENSQCNEQFQTVKAQMDEMLVLIITISKLIISLTECIHKGPKSGNVCFNVLKFI